MIPRRYIRHPSEIPILLIQVAGQSEELKLRDISLGGLCVQTPNFLADGTDILVRIPLLSPEFEARGWIVWCHYVGSQQALMGISFSDLKTAYSVRMMEQICHIESYRQRISRERGREYSSEEAALEWISLYAHFFPE